VSLITLWSGRRIPRIGVGCWAIGGTFRMHGQAAGWGEVDDAVSTRALHLAFDLGARLFDTADVYGIGHSEEVLGRAFADRRGEIVIATKFGFTHDPAARELNGSNATVEYMEQALAGSLRRLGTDRIDLYQLHVGDVADGPMDDLAAALERRAEAGDIDAWGWSTDDAFRVERMLAYPHFKSVQQQLSVFHEVPDMQRLADDHCLVNLNRSPLAMGLLTGKFTATTQLPANDVRSSSYEWLTNFRDGRPTAEALDKLDSIRDLLTTGGRTLAQGALSWILARSPMTVPIPGFKTEAQIRDNMGALDRGPLPETVMKEIDVLLHEPAGAGAALAR
jgi:aryl-alcohol dehydrogenase-like predicted oxidoreductase